MGKSNSISYFEDFKLNENCSHIGVEVRPNGFMYLKLQQSQHNCAVVEISIEELRKTAEFLNKVANEIEGDADLSKLIK